MACTAQQLMTAANCDICTFNAYMADAAELVLLCAIRDGNTSMACDPQTIIAQANCLLSCVPPGGYGAAKLAVLCDILAKGGSGGSGGTGGTQSLGSGVESGSVVFGTPLSSAPTAVVLTVQSPIGGFIMYGRLEGAPTSTGFNFQLSGQTDSASYVLHYVIIP